MKYLNTLQNENGENVDVDGHQHTKSEISDMPTQLSQLENDIGAGGGVVFTMSVTPPTETAPGDYWYKIL